MIVSHFGDVGDCLAGLANFEAAFGQTELVLYPAPGRCREPFTPGKVDKLRPFLELQPYIRAVRYAETPEGTVLDGWRGMKWGRHNLADMHADFLKVPHADREKSWLRVDAENRVAPIVIHRSPRYHGKAFPWREIVRHYAGNVVMVGSPDEHEEFCRQFGSVPHYPTNTYLDLARVIAGASLYIGNQSCPYWIALGLGKRTWLEQHRGRQGNCHWQRERAVYDRIKPFPSLWAVQSQFLHLSEIAD